MRYQVFFLLGGITVLFMLVVIMYFSEQRHVCPAQIQQNSQSAIATEIGKKMP